MLVENQKMLYFPLLIIQEAAYNVSYMVIGYATDFHEKKLPTSIWLV